MVMPSVLKAQSFRQLDGLAGVGEAKGRLTGGQRADAGDPRPSW